MSELTERQLRAIEDRWKRENDAASLRLGHWEGPPLIALARKGMEYERQADEIDGLKAAQEIQADNMKADIERLKQESNYWQMAAMHANEREEESQTEIKRLREALGGTIMEQEKDIVERLRYLVEDETGAINRERAEAADEIERLRSRLEIAGQQIGHLMAIRDAQSAILGQGRGGKPSEAHD